MGEKRTLAKERLRGAAAESENNSSDIASHALRTAQYFKNATLIICHHHPPPPHRLSWRRGAKVAKEVRAGQRHGFFAGNTSQFYCPPKKKLG